MLSDDLKHILADDEHPFPERDRLAALMALFAELPPPPDSQGLYPRYAEFQDRYFTAIDAAEPDAVEEAFLTLYCHVHGHEAPYSAAERRRMDETGGYWCHAGGVSPLLKAGGHIGPGTISADFGAGNGLQGLLMMKLYPHARTRQIEISSRMIASGRELQRWLGIDEDRVEWIAGDVLEQSPRGLDFIYLYRPVRPEGAGRRFYGRFAAELAAQGRPVVIFSIADCLRDFLGPEFEVFYRDGHLTCFRY